MSGEDSTADHVRAAYAAAVDEWAAAVEKVKRDGIVVADEKGKPVPHPALAVERSAAAEMRAWLPEVRRLERSSGRRPGFTAA